ncbi:MAG: AsmA-like C-terminal domain-containing protein [Candidatus Omnitrophota bacterium]|nr:AsmA-like C-terminal region-containing protein [Candidatus Omnitrophota bacterium]
MIKIVLPLIISVLFFLPAHALAQTPVSIFIDTSYPSQLKAEFIWEDKLILKSTYDKTTKEISAAIKVKNLDLDVFSPLIKNIEFISLHTGAITGNLYLEKENTYFVKGNLKIENLGFTYPSKYLHFASANEDLEFKGNLSLTILAPLPETLSTTTLAQSLYSIQGEIYKSEITNVPLFDNFSNINADFNLDREKVSFNITECLYPQKVYFPSKIKTTKTNRISAKGDLSYTKDKPFSLQIKTALGLEQLLEAANDIKKLPFQYDGVGFIELETLIKGNISTKPLAYHVDYNITNASFKDITNISTRGFIKNNHLIIEESTADYKGIPFDIRGRLDSFNAPQIELSINTGLLNANIKAQANKNLIDITELTINKDGINIISKAYLELSDPLTIKIEGFGEINSEKTIAILKYLKIDHPLIKRLNPIGNLSFKFQIEGNNDIREWTMKVAGAGKNINIYNIKAQELTIELYRDKNEITISPLTATIDDGQFELRAKLDFVNTNATLNITAINIDLAQLKDYLNLKNKTIEGKLSGRVYLHNNSLSNWEKLNGEGSVSVVEGNLWQFNLLKGLGEILYIPDFETIIFDKGYSDLVLKDENIVFKNLELNSDQINFKGEGKISVKGDIDFKLYPELSPLIISDSHELQNLIGQFLGKSGLGVEIKGTLKKPKYQVSPIFSSPLEGIKTIFEGILNEF